MALIYFVLVLASNLPVDAMHDDGKNNANSNTDERNSSSSSWSPVATASANLDLRSVSLQFTFISGTCKEHFAQQHLAKLHGALLFGVNSAGYFQMVQEHICELSFVLCSDCATLLSRPL